MLTIKRLDSITSFIHKNLFDRKFLGKQIILNLRKLIDVLIIYIFHDQSKLPLCHQI